ncbi:AMP-binding protein [Streptomyces sp. DH24]|uniref:AMP-binding protein n=1 Tax=Streptomyces sp. DH24 TaxID=3040123 RepID=UPI0024430E19|nr:AMP-binding protein [Streptomyces sp. DH24]MDG9715354.1 AMP-binding protein [Streptomyces sp. DH24]
MTCGTTTPAGRRDRNDRRPRREELPDKQCATHFGVPLEGVYGSGRLLLNSRPFSPPHATARRGASTVLPVRDTDIHDRLRAIVATVLELDIAEVSADASFHQNLKVDSLEKVEISVRIERHFGVTLTDEEAAAMDSVRDAAVLLGGRVPATGPTAGPEGPGLPDEPGAVTAPGEPAGIPAAHAAAVLAGTAPLTATESAASPVAPGKPSDAAESADPPGRGSPADPVDLVARLVGAHLDAGHGDRVGYFDPDVGEVSYARLYEAARGYAGALRALRVVPGSRALVLAEDSVATVVALLGLWWHGCVPVPVSPLLDEAQLRFLADDCAAAIVHVDGGPDRRRELVAAFGHLPQVTGCQVRDFLVSGAPTLPGRPGEVAPVAAWAPEREALVQYTSGSTGRPKGVRHSAGGINAMLDGFGSVAGLRPDDVVLSTARLSFGYGLGSSVLCPLAAGARTVLLRGAVDLYTVLAALRRYRPTVFCSVPRMYLSLLDALDRDTSSSPGGTAPGDSAGPRGDTVPGGSASTGSPSPGSFSAALRLCLSAGEDCPPELAHRIRRTFDTELMNCFGATEVMHVVIATPPSEPLPGSLGRPVPGVTVTVRDDQGRPVPDGDEGRLHIAGPTVALGYLHRPVENRATFADGGAYTGDLVRRLANGTIAHICRTDDVLNLGGYKVAPDQIERVVRSVDGVAECSVVGGSDENGLEQAVAFIVPVPGVDHHTLRKAVRVAVRTRLESYKRPSRMEFVEMLPATATGKLARYRLRQQAVRS